MRAGARKGGGAGERRGGLRDVGRGGGLLFLGPGGGDRARGGEKRPGISRFPKGQFIG